MKCKYLMGLFWDGFRAWDPAPRTGTGSTHPTSLHMYKQLYMIFKVRDYSDFERILKLRHINPHHIVSYINPHHIVSYINPHIALLMNFT